MVFILIVLLTYSGIEAQISINSIQVDTTITGFKFASYYDNMNVYTLNGPGDLQKDGLLSYFSVFIKSKTTYNKALDYLDDLLKLSKIQGHQQVDVVAKDTIIKDITYHEVALTEIEQGTSYKNILFNGFIIKDTYVLFFVSCDGDNGKYAEQFRNTFYSLKM
jgi:hypothetical protein